MSTNVDVTLGIVPEAYVKAVGLVVTQWAWAENILDQYIWRMLGVRALRGRIVTSHLGARMKIEMLAALLRKSNFDKSFVKEIEDEGKVLADFRNLVAHGAIAAGSGLGASEATIVSFAARGRLQVRTRRVDLTRLDALARRIATYLQYLIVNAGRLPKQRGIRPRQGTAGPKRRTLRIDTILRQLPPLLEVERAIGPTHSELEAAREKKREKRAADRQQNLAKKKESGAP